MQRYEEFINIINDPFKNGKRRYETILYPRIPVKATDIYILSKKLDRLDNIAYEYYGDQRYWWIIKVANNLPGGTLQIPAGSRIRIPYPLNVTQIDELIKEKQF